MLPANSLLMNDRITIRPATPEDHALLFTLFAEEKAAELASLRLSAGQLQPLLQMQYRGREFSYSQSSANLADSILCLGDGTPVGRILIDRQADGIRVMDVAVLAACRGRGIGSHALQQVQQAAQKDALPVRLRVMKDSRAQRLYQRLGFTAVASDAISMEMACQPARTDVSANSSSDFRAAAGERIGRLDQEVLVSTIVGFLREIGLEVQLGSISPGDFLPGVQMVRNGLRVDPERLLHPGDLLHEAGHLAVMPPSRRLGPSPSSQDAAEEMGALAWSYAAALHIGMDPRIVFHESGYRGQANQLLHDFAHGRAVGLPYLWWIGMTTQPQAGQPSIYPRMLRWLRDDHTPAQEADVADCVQRPHA